MDRERRAALTIIFFTLLITAFMATEAVGIAVDGDYTKFFPWGESDRVVVTDGFVSSEGRAAEEDASAPISSTFYRTGLRAALGESGAERDYTYTSTMYVLVSSENLYTPSFLDLLSDTIDRIDSRRDSARPGSVLDWMTFSGSDEHPGLIPMSPKEGLRWTEAEAEELRRRIAADPTVRYYLVGGSGNSILLSFVYADFSSGEQLRDIDSELEGLRDAGARTVMMSNMVIADRVMTSLRKDLTLLLPISLFILLAVSYLSFHSIRSVLVPASSSIFALVWTLGTMYMRGMDLNIVSLLCPFMVLILGSTYSVHVLSAYCGGMGKSAFRAAGSVSFTVLLGALTTVAGFLALTLSSSPALLSFAVPSSIGVIYCTALSLLYIPSVLTLLPSPSPKSVRKVRDGVLMGILKGVGRTVIRHYAVFLLIFLIIAGAACFCYGRMEFESDYMSYFSPSDPFCEEVSYFASEIGGTAPFTVTLRAPEGERNFFLDMENLGAVWRWQEKVKESGNVLQILSFPSYVAFLNRELTGEEGIPADTSVGRIMQGIFLTYADELAAAGAVVSKDFNTLTLTVQAWDGERKDLATTKSTEETYRWMRDCLSLLPEGTEVEFSGFPVLSLKFASSMEKDQGKCAILSLLAVFLLSSIALKSPLKGLAALVPVLSGIMGNYIFMTLASIPFDIVTVSFASVAVGAGVDDAVHFSRMYITLSMRHEGEGRRNVWRAYRKTCRPIFLTTIGVSMAMAVLAYATYMPVRYFGLLMSVTLLSCMLSTLLFLPPFYVLGIRIRGLFRRKRL